VEGTTAPATAGTPAPDAPGPPSPPGPSAAPIPEVAGAQRLDGPWRAAPSDPERARSFFEPDHDDADWAWVPVPAHWRAAPELASADGPVCYRRRIAAGALEAGARRFVTFEGILASADVWCDGTYLGATGPWFAPHTFELAARAEHTLAVEVHCPLDSGAGPRHGLLGTLGEAAAAAGWNPGGIWRPVRFHHTGPVRIAALRVGCREAGAERAVLAGRVALDAGPESGRRVRLRWRCADQAGTDLAAAEQDATLAAGRTELAWTLAVDRPPRWWPWRLGDQPLVHLTVEVLVDGRCSDARALRTGLRELRLRDWRLEVNGVPLFAIGSATGPHRLDPAAAAPDGPAGDVRLAREANLDLLRLWGHVGGPDTYAAADELGVLLWQDLPLVGRAARSLRRPAVEAARRLVEVCSAHPSVVMWCAHDAPFPSRPGPGAGIPARARHLAARLAPAWTREVLDRAAARTLRQADPTRPVVRASGLLPGLFSTGTDWHASLGWTTGRFDALAGRARALPRLARWVSRIEAASLPESARTRAWGAHRGPDGAPGGAAGNGERPASGRSGEGARSRRDRSRSRTAPVPAVAPWSPAAQEAVLAAHVPPEAFDDFDAWRDAGQSYQAALVQLQVEDLRRLRWRPSGGCCQHTFADPAGPAATEPAGPASPAVLDARRVPKPAFAALRAAGRSVLPMLEPRRGLVHVANETGERYPGAQVTVRLGGRIWRFTGEVAPRSVTYVGRVRVDREASPAWVRLDHPDLGSVTNGYDRVLGWLRIVDA
jgi:beta-mannosidase